MLSSTHYLQLITNHDYVTRLLSKFACMSVWTAEICMTILCFSPSLTFTNSLVVAFISSQIGGNNKFEGNERTPLLHFDTTIVMGKHINTFNKSLPFSSRYFKLKLFQFRISLQILHFDVALLLGTRQSVRDLRQSGKNEYMGVEKSWNNCSGTNAKPALN